LLYSISSFFPLFESLPSTIDGGWFSCFDTI
jgi:hypothetical protein